MKNSKFKSFIRDYFTLTSRERKGSLVLAIIIIVQIIIIIRMNYFQPPDENVLQKYSMETIRFELETNSKNNKQNQFANSAYSSDSISERNERPLTNFNPNTISDSGWIAMGLSVKQTTIIRNYLNKGGSFRDKKSLSKIYGISASQYQKLEPFITIPEPQSVSTIQKANKFTPKKETHKVNINTADTLLLTELPLIGPGRARMIYKYREALGGFHEIKQLLEVYTIDSSTLMIVEPYIEIDSGSLRKININSENIKHPYITKQMAKVIDSYRKQHGDFTHITELKHISLMTDQIYTKLVPYVAFE